VTSGNTVEFQISASQAGMIDWSQSYLLSRLTMVQTTDWAAVVHQAATAAVEATATPAQLATDADAAMPAPRPIRPFEENEGPEEAFSAAMWSSCELYINGVLVSDATQGLYPYADYFRNCLTKPASWASGGVFRYARVSAGKVSAVPANRDKGVNMDGNILGLNQMKPDIAGNAGGWGSELCGYTMGSDRAVGASASFESSGGMNMGPTAVNPYQSPGLAYRQSKVAPAYRGNVNAPQSEWITLPAIGIARQTGFLPGDCDYRLVMTKNNAPFYMHGTEPKAPEINWATAGANSVRLFLKRVYPSPALQETITKMNIERPFRYNTTQARMARTNIGTASAVDVVGLLTGPRPDVVCVMFITDAAVSGAYSRSPFCSTDVIQPSAAQVTSGLDYGTAGDLVTQIYCTWGGKTFPQRPIQAVTLDDNGQAYAAYLAACEGGHFGETQPLLSAASFRAGRKMFCFALNPDQSPAGSTAMDLSDRGSLEVHATIQRNGTFTESTSMITCGFHAASVEIDRTRSVRKEGF